MNKSTVVKRSIVVSGHKTSVSLEDEFWRAIKAIAAARGLTLSELIGSVESARAPGANLSSSLRLFILTELERNLGDRAVVSAGSRPSAHAGDAGR